MTDHDHLTIRAGGPGDARVILHLLDVATEWLVSNGRVGQWGTGPASADPRRIAQAETWAASGGLHLAVVDDHPVGALVVGAPAADHIPPATEPELYVNLLVTDRAYAGRGIGARLLAHAEELARVRGVGLLRLDCYSGDDGALVRWYERSGFTRTDPFAVRLPDRTWPGQVLARRLD